MTDIATFGLSEWAEFIHNWAHDRGFYTNERSNGRGGCPGDKTCSHASGSTTAAIMLVVTELAEAVEALRKEDDVNFAEEIADAVIRLLDLSMAEGLDIAAEVQAKMNKNLQRPHRHGKAF